MRMRKLPWAQEYIEQSNIVVHHPSEYKGKWKSLLKTSVLHLEIGAGKGDYWIQMSQMYPNEGWIAIEKNQNVAAIALKKIDSLQQCKESMAFICKDAVSVEEWFETQEIDVIHLNFSDPWPKKRAHKKRLSHASFLKSYRNVLSDQGCIQMKTDNSDLFEFSLLQFQEANWYLHEISVDYRRNEHQEDAISEYERKFMEKGNPIYRAVFKKYPYVNKDTKKR